MQNTNENAVGIRRSTYQLRPPYRGGRKAHRIRYKIGFPIKCTTRRRWQVGKGMAGYYGLATSNVVGNAYRWRVSLPSNHPAIQRTARSLMKIS